MISEMIADPILGSLLFAAWIAIGIVGAQGVAAVSYSLGTALSIVLYSVGVITGPLLLLWTGITWTMAKFHKGAWTGKQMDSIRLLAFVISVFLISTPILIFW